MPTKRDNVFTKPDPITFPKFPKAIERPTMDRCPSIIFSRGDIKRSRYGNVTSRGGSPVVSETKIYPISPTFCLPSTSDHAITDKRKYYHNVELLRSVSSDLSTYTTNRNIKHEKSTPRSSRKAKYCFNMCDLYTRTPKTHFFQNINEHRRMIDNLAVRTDACKVLTEKHEASVSSNSAEELIKKWIQDAYKARRLHMDSRDTYNTTIASFSQSSFSVVHNNAISLLESQLSRVPSSRRSSVIKPRRKSSVLLVPLENDNLTESEWSRMPNWAQSVMRLSPNERAPQDVQHLKQLLANMRSFTENITDEMRTSLCQVVRYTRCDKGRIVFRQGHIGMDFYFIFSGSVLIQSDLYNDKTGATETLVENVLRAGDGFGEIALLGDGRRTASVICKEPTELCQIDKATFLNISSALFSEQLQDRIDFARTFEIFQSWNKDALKKLCFLSQVLDIPHSRVIERNWATSKFAYFIMKGRVSMLKEFDVTAVLETVGQRQRSVVESKVKGSEKKVTHYAVVGTLQDLSVLASDPRKGIPKITLVSEGVRLFRVSVPTFLRLSSRTTMEEYLKFYTPQKFPTEDELFARYLTDLNWTEFKKNIIHTNRLEKAGSVLASIPATLKGSSGWARWPGYAIIPRTSKVSRSIETVRAVNQPVGAVNQPVGAVNQPVGAVNEPVEAGNQPVGAVNQPVDDDSKDNETGDKNNVPTTNTDILNNETRRRDRVRPHKPRSSLTLSSILAASNSIK